MKRVKLLEQDVVVTFPSVLWDSDLNNELFRSSSFTLHTSDTNIPIAYGLDREDIAHLEKLDKWNPKMTIPVPNGRLVAYANPNISFQEYLDHWQDCLRDRLRIDTSHLQTNPIHQRAYARVGLMGNPSDGFFGKTMSLLISNFWAEVTLIPNRPEELETITILPNPVSDPHSFLSMACLAGVSEIDGYETGDRLLQACCKVFYRHCQAQKIPINTEQGFTVLFETNIPRQVGLAGSSAIITALWKALMVFYGVTEKQIPLELQASLVLKVEQDELGIAAGLQDRVIQVYIENHYKNGIINYIVVIWWASIYGFQQGAHGETWIRKI